MNQTTEKARPTMTGQWLKWAWRHGGLDVEQFDSLDEAIESAVWASERGEESFECIEGPTGVIDQEDVQRIWRQVEERHDDRNRAQRAANPQTHGIKLRGPSEAANQRAWLDTYGSQSEAEAAAEVLRERFGDRISVVGIPD